VRLGFSGTIPAFYDDCLGAAWFDAFATDLARRLPADLPGDVLEIACGTGRLTRKLRHRFDPTRRLVATDISCSMLEHARNKLGDDAGIDWRVADAVRLPFDDGEFRLVVCGFGLMFPEDRQAAFREVRRVLGDGGTLLFNVWDRIEENPHAIASTRVVASCLPDEECRRFGVPYGMHETKVIHELLAGARFEAVSIEKTRIQVDCLSAREISIGLVRGTPRSTVFGTYGLSIDELVDRLTAELTEIGGADPYRSHAQAIVVEARAR
jgi:SAM-dependent methyltransferase